VPLALTMKMNHERLFLDNEKELLKWVEKEQIKPLTRYGAIVRQHARKSIKILAPTTAMIERTRDADPKKRARALKTLAKRRAKVSPAGSPPYSHVRNYKGKQDSISIRNIQYAYDTRASYEFRMGTLVAGPVHVNGAKANNVPERLERGGTVWVYRVLDSGVWRIVSDKAFARWKGKKRRSQGVIKPRPTMSLALAATGAHLPSQFQSRGG